MDTRFVISETALNRYNWCVTVSDPYARLYRIVFIRALAREVVANLINRLNGSGDFVVAVEYNDKGDTYVHRDETQRLANDEVQRRQRSAAHARQPSKRAKTRFNG